MKDIPRPRGEGYKSSFRRRAERVGSAILRAFEEPKDEPQPLNARGFFMGIRMSEAPDFYSGLPAHPYEYSGNRLQTGYNLLSEQVSKDAATDFAQMILDMPSLAPTNFVMAVNEFARRGWKYEPDVLEGKTEPSPHVLTTDPHAPQEWRDWFKWGRDYGRIIPDAKETNEIKASFRRQLEEKGVQIEEQKGRLVIVSANQEDTKSTNPEVDNI